MCYAKNNFSVLSSATRLQAGITGLRLVEYCDTQPGELLQNTGN
jgi:hypothetical protein